MTPAALPGYDVPDKASFRMMVAVKQVGRLGDDVAIADDGRDVDASRLEYALNEWDDSALEEALRLVERLGGGEVVAVTVGPERADEVLHRVLAKGAQRAVRVWHDDLAGADAITIARALAGIARHERPDVILTGAQSADQAQGATGAALARMLDLPHVGVAVALDWDGAGPLMVVRELEDGGHHRVALPTPALASVQTGANQPRYATIRMIKAARAKPLVFVEGAAALDRGAFGRVRRAYLPQVDRGAEMLAGDADEVAACVDEIIRETLGDR